MNNFTFTHIPQEVSLSDLFGKLPDPLLLCRPNGELVYANKPARRLLEANLDTALQTAAQDLVEIFDPADAQQAQKIFTRHRAHWSKPLRLLGDQPCVVRMWVGALPNQGSGDWKVVRLRDVTSPQQDVKRLRKLAYRDPLTDLPNRAAFGEILSRRIKGLKDDRAPSFGVILVDIDRFQRINDRFGHAVGDALLCQFRDRARRRLRKEDILARLTGNQFAILLNSVGNQAELKKYGHRVADFAAEPFTPQGQTCYIDLSVGMVLASPQISEPRDLIRFAELALYQAKGKASKDIVVYDHALHARIRRSSKLEDDLRDALEQEQLKLHYQPIVEPETERIVSLEALSRWEHPTEGAISPAEFIPIAEESDLIADLSRWTLWQACKQAYNWRWRYRSYGDLSISVNMSARELLRPNFSDMIGEVLGDSGLSGHGLDIEITENVLLETPEETLQELQMIRVFGAQLSIDDFGTGYSSLSYIQQLPVGRVKIDRQFIHDLPDSQQSQEIVQVVMDLAEKLGLEVVAEGVETHKQLEVLTRLGSPLIQGYYYSPPVEASEIEELLNQPKLSGADWEES